MIKRNSKKIWGKYELQRLSGKRKDDREISYIYGTTVGRPFKLDVSDIDF